MVFLSLFLSHFSQQIQDDFTKKKLNTFKDLKLVNTVTVDSSDKGPNNDLAVIQTAYMNTGQLSPHS